MTNDLFYGLLIFFVGQFSGIAIAAFAILFWKEQKENR